MEQVSMKALLEAGVHFGHQTRRWNPKMARYIYAARNDIYIIDLQKTVRQIKKACNYLKDLVRKGGKVLFISTKKQAQEIIESEAKRCGMLYCTQRWLGGTLTNWQTIYRRILHLRDIERQQNEGRFELLSKKEKSRMLKQKARLEKYLMGIKDMEKLPDCVYIIDPRREHIPVLEARRLGVPIVGIVDTNCDPDEIDIVIPGNDDAIRAIKLITGYLVDAINEGLKERDVAVHLTEKDKAAATAEGGTAVAVEPAAVADAAAVAGEAEVAGEAAGAAEVADETAPPVEPEIPGGVEDDEVAE